MVLDFLPAANICLGVGFRVSPIRHSFSGIYAHML